jgi:hypothetical protein
MAIKSALMTTATDKDTRGKPIQNDSGPPGNPFGYGAGEVQPKLGMDPGLVYDSSYTDWAKFVCGSGQVPSTHELCAGGAIDPSDLNYPTIAIGDLAGKQTVTRTVTNAGTLPEVYFPKVEGLTGLKVTVSPRILITLPGRSTTYKGDDREHGRAAGAVLVRQADLEVEPARGEQHARDQAADGQGPGAGQRDRDGPARCRCRSRPGTPARSTPPPSV